MKETYGALRPQKPSWLVRDGEVGGSGVLYLNSYSLSRKRQFFEEHGEPKRIEPRSFCSPA